MIEINGEFLSNEEASGLIKMMYRDAKEMAGVFHGMNRSAKFRANWPSEYEFADSEWKNFVAAVRQMYVERLRDPKTPAPDARKMHLAIVLERMAGEGKESDTRLQLAPGTQQFEGDKAENKSILEKFGTNVNLRAQLRKGVARILN